MSDEYLPIPPHIAMEVAAKGMAEAAQDAFSLGYVNPEWRAMKRRLFAYFREQYETAKEAQCQTID